jgi:hypothetical protein
MVTMTRLQQLKQALAKGGKVRFNMRTGQSETIDDIGHRQPLDGRSLDTFLLSVAHGLIRTETTSEETKDLLIEWASPKK